MLAHLVIAGSRRLAAPPTDAVVADALVRFGLTETQVERVLHGCCRGADLAGARWGATRRIPVVGYDPKFYGDLPGGYHARNRTMAVHCTHAVVLLWWPPGLPEPVMDPSHADNRGSRSLLGFLREFKRPTALYAVDMAGRRWRRLEVPP